MQEIQVTKEKAFELANALIATVNSPGIKADSESSEDLNKFRKFRYAVSKTNRALSGETKDIEEELESFNKEIDEAQERNAFRDTDGNPVKVNGKFQIQNQVVHDKEVAELREKHNVDEIMSEEITINVHMVDEENVPACLPIYIFDKLMVMISDGGE